MSNLCVTASWVVGLGDIDLGAIRIGKRLAAILDWLGHSAAAARLRADIDRAIDMRVAEASARLARSARETEERMIRELYK